MQVHDCVIVISSSQPHYGEVGQITDMFYCFITVQFGGNPNNWCVYFPDELLSVKSPSIGTSSPLAALTVN